MKYYNFNLCKTQNIKPQINIRYIILSLLTYLSLSSKNSNFISILSSLFSIFAILGSFGKRIATTIIAPKNHGHPFISLLLNYGFKKNKKISAATSINKKYPEESSDFLFSFLSSSFSKISCKSLICASACSLGTPALTNLSKASKVLKETITYSAHYLSLSNAIFALFRFFFKHFSINIKIYKSKNNANDAILKQIGIIFKYIQSYNFNRSKYVEKSKSCKHLFNWTKCFKHIVSLCYLSFLIKVFSFKISIVPCKYPKLYEKYIMIAVKPKKKKLPSLSIFYPLLSFIKIFTSSIDRLTPDMSLHKYQSCMSITIQRITMAIIMQDNFFWQRKSSFNSFKYFLTLPINYFGKLGITVHNFCKIGYAQRDPIPSNILQCQLKSILIEFISMSDLLNLFSISKERVLNLFSIFINIISRSCLVAKSIFLKLLSICFSNALISYLPNYLFKSINSTKLLFNDINSLLISLTPKAIHGSQKAKTRAKINNETLDSSFIYGLRKLVDKTSSFILFILCQIQSNVKRKIVLGVYSHGY